MNSIEKLTQIFRTFPGIGPRQAKRFVYYLLRKDAAFLSELSKSILELKDNISQCTMCYRFYSSTNQDSNMCNVCSDNNINKETLMLVEKDVDFENIHKNGIYDGYYFILGGQLPILEKEPARKIRINELLRTIKTHAGNGLKEIIFAVSVNPEGENTTLYIKKTIEPMVKEFNIKVSTLGRGLSTGTELEYSDSDTLQNALKNRGSAQ